jgi:hypothetical protein
MDNKNKPEQFKDVNVYQGIEGYPLSAFIRAKYLGIGRNHLYKVTDDDPLNLHVPKFEGTFYLRFYCKNHGKQSGINVSCTVRLATCNPKNEYIDSGCCPKEAPRFRH